MTQVHPKINTGLQQIRSTCKYIPKLQLHQHSLLTRKVFSQHNFHLLWIISSYVSSSRLHLQVIFIFGSGSSLDLDHHHQIWIITGHDHWIWIITQSRSSLDINTRSMTSLDLDHHRCYLMILLVTGSSTEPTLFHASCRSSLHVGLLHCLYLTLSQNGLPNTYI